MDHYLILHKRSKQKIPIIYLSMISGKNIGCANSHIKAKWLIYLEVNWAIIIPPPPPFFSSEKLIENLSANGCHFVSASLLVLRVVYCTICTSVHKKLLWIMCHLKCLLWFVSYFCDPKIVPVWAWIMDPMAKEKSVCPLTLVALNLTHWPLGDFNLILGR